MTSSDKFESPPHYYVLKKYSSGSPFNDMMSFWMHHSRIIKDKFKDTGDLDEALVFWWHVLIGNIDQEGNIKQQV